VSTSLYAKPYTGTFTTQTIRLLWMGCYQGTMSVDSRNPTFNGALCDCIVNKTREKYTSQEVEKYQGATMQRKYTEIANQCRGELLFQAPRKEDMT